MTFSLLLMLSLTTGHGSLAVLAVQNGHDAPAGPGSAPAEDAGPAADRGAGGVENAADGGSAGSDSVADPIDDLPDGSEPVAVVVPERGHDSDQAADIEKEAGPEAEAEPPVPARAPVIPDGIRGIYLTAYAAADRAWAASLVRLIEETELNAIVIDVKNDSGHISLQMPDGSGGIVPHLPELLADLKRSNIYTIARIVVFKDPGAASSWPERTARTTAGTPWRDYSGIAWLDPYNTDNWDHNIEVALQAAALGFDEIQFDYVRFPSDGNVRDLVYPAHDGRSRAEVIAAFLAAARAELHAVGVPVSADIFGLVTSTEDDMGIGQLLEPMAAAVDVLSPMMYPSHYGAGNYGLPNPNAAPYETISRGLEDALRRLGPGSEPKLRPWLQDFSMGHPYGPDEVRAQIHAAEELGVRQWLLWNAANVYTRAALGPPEPVEPAGPPVPPPIPE